MIPVSRLPLPNETALKKLDILAHMLQSFSIEEKFLYEFVDVILQVQSHLI